MPRRWLLCCALLCPACAGAESAPDPAPVTAALPADPGAAVRAGSVGDPSSSSDPPSPGSAECEALLGLAGEIGCGIVKLWCAAATVITVGHAKIPCDIAVAFACDVAGDAVAAAEKLCALP
jgi:hypothetical protein